MLERLRVGILGAGLAGTGHALAFARLRNVEVTALWSRTRIRAEKLAGRLRRPGLQVYDCWQDLIEKAEVDIVSLATPPTLRREPFIMALDRGCHVLVEKPLSVGLADARAMAQAAKRSSAVTAVCFNWRYAPACQLVWREARAGRIGQIRDIRTEQRFRATNREFFASRPWATQSNDGGEPLGESISHDFDRARFLTGCEFTQIVARIVPFSLVQDGDLAVESGSHIHLAELTGGVLGSFRFTMTAGEDEWSYVLSGDRGTMRATIESVVCQCVDDIEPMSLEIEDRIPKVMDPMQYTWGRLVADFVTAIRRSDWEHETVPHLPTLIDGLRVQEAIAAAGRSEKERRWVSLEETRE